MEAVGLAVNRLIRVSYGPFQLGQLKPGEVEEIRRRVLRDQLGLDNSDAESGENSTIKPRKQIISRNKPRITPSEADIFGERRAAPGKAARAKPAPKSAAARTPEAKPPRRPAKAAKPRPKPTRG